MASETTTELASQSSSANYQLAVIEDLIAQGNLAGALEQANAVAQLRPRGDRIPRRLYELLNEIGDDEKR